MASSVINPWKRQGYPLQSTISSLTTQHPDPAPPEQESTLAKEAYSSRVGKHEEASTGSDGQNRRVVSLQLFTNDVTALPASTPSSPEIGVEDVNQTTTCQAQESNQAARVSKPWHRNTYPLQAPVSNVDLRHLPTPPPSPETEPQPDNEVHADQTRENNQVIDKEIKAFHRRAYPLQVPASNANLRRSSTPSSLERQPQHASQASTEKHRENNQASTVSKAFRRQVYPLQVPASNANLRRSPTPSSSKREPQDTNEVSTKEFQEHDQAGKVAKTFRRQVYPLQTPASITNLRGSPTPPSSPEGEAEHATAVNHEDLRGSNHAAKGSQTSSASVADLRRPPSPLPPSPIGRGTQSENKSSATKCREEELASKVINQWRRQAYPLQSPKNVSPFQRLATPHPREHEAEKDDTSRSIHLPRNIRAATDSEGHDQNGRSIVVCLDGTGDKFDNDNSNIVHLISALKKDDPHQVSYYQAGIGTYSSSGLSAGASAAMDMAIGSGLGLHVRDAYNFLMHSYKEGDKICIFGFSRGAYTARCLAGMIHKVGLLPPRNLQQVPFAYEFYKNDTPEGWKQSEDFKKTFCIDVCVHFLGCFDSVASVGFIPRQLPLSSTPTSKPRYFRHAMALDERRAKFKICRHQTKDWDEIEQAAPPIDATAKSARSNSLRVLPNYKDLDDAPPRYTPHMRYGKSNHPNLTDQEYEILWGHEASFDTDVLEVWFLGAHADVGGGAVPNDERHKLAQIPLRWMIRQAFDCNTGIIFKTEVLAEYGLDVHTLWPKYERLNAPVHGPPPSFLEKYEDDLPPRSIRRSKLVPIKRQEKGEHFYHLKGRADEDWTPEQLEDFYDAMSPLNDQLVQAPSWWLLELWPVRYKVPIGLGEVSTRLGMNLGRYRGVDDYEPNVHWTVLHRVEHMGYKIQARTYANTTWRTVV
ncbi:hypothetical protein LTR70_000030 [Exophiala xenobiotica]|uniref:T6SS Phospholipase effector Tle1-like catalytic domain-containing protein n=1 Tax=Lithohypha guttulata TaxID=1690604 RepID=A0ABR0K604_9EURO|nr:hypothetical protein LTR24_006962 [Lithohypha guttulata]KAK5330708.1 hypothetical protein LTR70_000030 [Exophiala xenobiotica]